MTTKKTDQDSINAAILEQLELLDIKIERIGTRNSRMKDLFAWCWNHKALGIALLIGLVLGCFTVSIYHFDKSTSFRFFQNDVSPDVIVRYSPDDPIKRNIIASEYKDISDRIRRGTILSVSECLDAIRMSTIHVRSDPGWKSTFEVMDRYIGCGPELSDVDVKVRALSDAFNRY